MAKVFYDFFARLSLRMGFTSLLFVKARFYTHLLEPSKKTFAWEDRYIIHCSGASAILTIVSAHPPALAEF